MEWWIILLILLGASIGFFGAIFHIITANKKKKSKGLEIVTENVEIVEVQPPHSELKHENVSTPYNPGFIYQPQQGPSIVITLSNPSTSSEPNKF